MHKKQWLILILPAIFACNFLFPQTGQSTTPPTPPTVAATQETESQPTNTPNSDTPFAIVRINIANGDLASQLSIEAQKAKELSLSPFIEFDATWCPPCQAINASLEAKDPLTIKAFTGIYLIRADVDEWGWGDGNVFNFQAIPIYYRLDESGKPTGDHVDGGAWNADIPENFDPVLDVFFHKN